MPARMLTTTAILGIALACAGQRVAVAQSPDLDALRAPVETFAFAPAFAAPRDKSVTVVTCGAVGIGCQQGAEAATEAAAELGWQTRIIDGRFDPAVWNQAVQQAVADGADGVILFAITPALIQGGLDAANAANVPIVAVYQPRFEGVPDVQGYVTTDHARGGRAAAELIASDSGGSGHVLLLDVAEYPEIMKRNDALAAHLAEICAGCVLDRESFNGALASQRLAPLVASRLQQDASIGYVVGPFDAIGTFIVQGVRQAQAADRVKYINFEGNPVGFDQMANGEQFADVATAAPFSGWLAVDMMARILAGGDYSSDVELPQRVFVDGDTLPDASEGWDADFDYRPAMKALWQQ